MCHSKLHLSKKNQHTFSFLIQFSINVPSRWTLTMCCYLVHVIHSCSICNVFDSEDENAECHTTCCTCETSMWGPGQFIIYTVDLTKIQVSSKCVSYWIIIPTANSKCLSFSMVNFKLLDMYSHLLVCIATSFHLDFCRISAYNG